MKLYKKILYKKYSSIREIDVNFNKLEMEVDRIFKDGTIDNNLFTSMYLKDALPLIEKDLVDYEKTIDDYERQWKYVVETIYTDCEKSANPAIIDHTKNIASKVNNKLSGCFSNLSKGAIAKAMIVDSLCNVGISIVGSKAINKSTGIDIPVTNKDIAKNITRGMVSGSVRSVVKQKTGSNVKSLAAGGGSGAISDIAFDKIFQVNKKG